LFAARNLARNSTAIEVWNDRNAVIYDKGCLENYEEVCGSRSWIACWPVPCCFCFRPLEDGFYHSARIESDGASIQTPDVGGGG
jgi:hypothetical protein